MLLRAQQVENEMKNLNRHVTLLQKAVGTSCTRGC